MTENGRLVEEITALRVKIFQLDDLVAQLKAQRVDDTKHAEECQAFSDLQIHRLKVTMQQDSDSWRAEAKDFEHRVEELIARQSASATAQVMPWLEY